MSGEGDRPQDVGRSHHRRSARTPETERVLEAYRVALRAELEETLGELRPPPAEQLGMDGSARIVKPALEVRKPLWELAMKLARELGEGPLEDLPPEVSSIGGSAPAPRKPRGAPRITARDRRSLG